MNLLQDITDEFERHPGCDGRQHQYTVKRTAYQSNDADAQRWAITPSPGQCGYSLQSKSNGYYLTVAGGNASAGANVYVNYASFTPNAQAWLFIPYRPEQPLEDGKYIIVSSVDDTLELDVSGNSEEAAEETNVQVWHDDSEEYYENSLSRYNAFNVERLDNGYYKLIQSVSGKSADLFAGGDPHRLEHIHAYG